MNEKELEVDFLEYKTELESINQFNPVEVSIHFIVGLLLRITLRNEYFITDVLTRRRYKNNGATHYYSESYFPDLAILRRGEKNPCCVVKLKYLPYKKGLDHADNKDQVYKHAEKFGYSIFTNGLE